MKRLTSGLDTTTTVLISIWALVVICALFFMAIVYLAPKFIALHQSDEATNTTLAPRQIKQNVDLQQLSVNIRLLDFSIPQEQQPAPLSWRSPLISGSQIGFELHSNIPLQVVIQTKQQTLYQTTIEANQTSFVPKFNEGALLLDDEPTIEHISLIITPLQSLNQTITTEQLQLTPSITDEVAIIEVELNENNRSYLIEFELNHTAED